MRFKNYIIKNERVVWCSVLFCVEMEVFINENVNFGIKIMNIYIKNREKNKYILLGSVNFF